MNPAARILLTAATLAALSTLGVAATATATVPPSDEHPTRPAHPTTAHPLATAPAMVAHAGHGAQIERDDTTPATASQHPTDRAAPAPAGGSRQNAPTRAVILLGLGFALAGVTWLRHRPHKAA